MVKKGGTLSYYNKYGGAGDGSMTTARQRFLINKLLERKNPVYRVASRYVAAGFHVRVEPNLEDVHVIAVKQGERYGIHVLWEKRVYGEDKLEKFIKSCRKNGLKPVIILYGAGPRISPDALSRFEEEDIVVRRVRC